MSHGEGQPFKSKSEILKSDPNIANVDQSYPDKYCTECLSIIPKSNKYCPKCGKLQSDKIIAGVQQPILIQTVKPNQDYSTCSEMGCQIQSQIQCQKCSKYYCERHIRMIRSDNHRSMLIYCRKCAADHLNSRPVRNCLITLVVLVAVVVVILVIM